MAGSKRRTNGQVGFAPEKLGMRPATTDHLKKKLPFRVWHPVVTDNELSVGLEAAQKAYDDAKVIFEAARARSLNYPANKEAKAELDDATAVLAEAIEAHDQAREAAAEATVYVVMKAPPMHIVEEIQRAHPPTEKEKEEWAKIDNFPEDRWPSFSQATIGPAMIAACLIEPEMDEDEVREGIWENDDWNEAEKAALLAAAYSTGNRATVSLGKAYGPIRSDASNKPSSTVTASPEAGGSDE